MLEGLFNADTEKALLGGLLTNPEGWELVKGKLEPADFSMEWHQLIYATMRKIGDEISLSLTAVSLALEGKPQGILGYLADLNRDIYGPMDGRELKKYADKVKELSRARQQYNFAQTIEKELASNGLAADHGRISSAAQEIARISRGVTQDNCPGKNEERNIKRVEDLPDWETDMSENQTVWLIPDLIAAGALHLISGESGAGKPASWPPWPIKSRAAKRSQDAPPARATC
jgi:replicative DNA helicase